jgi:hypothetical protein
VIRDLMIHDSIPRLATRSRVTEIHAVGVPVLTSKIDIANARLVFESGCVANLTASRIRARKDPKIRFFEGAEYLSIDRFHRTVEAYAPHARRSRAKALPPPISSRESARCRSTFTTPIRSRRSSATSCLARRAAPILGGVRDGARGGSAPPSGSGA